MKQSFLIVYFVLYLVAVVALLAGSGGGRIPCGQLADSMSVSLSEGIYVTAPRTVQVQLYRLKMGSMTVEGRPRTTNIPVYATGLVSPQEREKIVYQVTAHGSAPQLECVTDRETGIGLIAYRFTQVGKFRYTITGEVDRHIPDKLPLCVRELLSGLQGKTLTSSTDVEVIVEYDYIEPPIR